MRYFFLYSKRVITLIVIKIQGEGYECSKKPLTNERAITAYRKVVERTTVYKNAEHYALVLSQ